MHTEIKSATTTISTSDSAGSKPIAPGVYVYYVEFNCLLCGRFVTSVKVASENAPIQLPPRLRCKACGGNPCRSTDVEKEFLPFVDRGPWPKRRGRPTNAQRAYR